MTQLILKKSGEIISYHREGKSITVDGIYVSPAYAGWAFGDYTLEAAPEPEPDTSEPEPPTDEEILASKAPVSQAQITAALVILGHISEAEGVAWLTGTLPDEVLGVIATLPSDQQVIAKMRAIRFSQAVPGDPLVTALAAANEMTTADLIELFDLAASL